MIRSKGTVYISGPMTGYPDFNVYAFDEARDHIMAAGYSVIVPGDDETYEPVEVDRMEVAPTKRADYMRKDFLAIQVVTMVAVLDGWNLSRGSRAEVLIAQEIGVPVVYWDTMEPITSEVVTYATKPEEDERDSDQV